MRDLKAEKIRDMTRRRDARRSIRELSEELFNLRFRNAMRQLENPLKIRETRRDIARLQTLLTRAPEGHSQRPPAKEKAQDVSET